MNTVISIAPVSVWTPTGTKTATQFAPRYVSYQNGPAVADCQLLDVAGAEVAAQLVNATAAQTATWTSDEAFYKVLAQNAGLTPL
jgi:hypothetical protein